MFEEKDHLIKRFSNMASVDLCRAIVDRHFPAGEEERFNGMSLEEFHERVYAAQRDINSENIQDRIYQHEKPVFDREIGPSLMRESVCFLRAVRPSKKDTGKSEAVGLHRETMYSDAPHEISHCVNMWFPIRGVNQSSSLKYIPNSHLVPDADLQIEIDGEGPRVKKHSTGHKLGFLYAPKRIVGGVDLNNLQTFKLSYGEYVLFSAMLVHGAAANHGSEIRFSLSMAIVPQDKVVVNKSYFAAGGKSHYEKFGSSASNPR
jgi:hypothetical protein